MFSLVAFPPSSFRVTPLDIDYIAHALLEAAGSEWLTASTEFQLNQFGFGVKVCLSLSFAVRNMPKRALSPRQTNLWISDSEVTCQSENVTDAVWSMEHIV